MAMWTNVFRLGDLSTISWFQFLPCESDASTLSEDSLKAWERDASTLSVLHAHLKLQSEGFLTTWTNSFVGPWDPSQGVHNPDEKIKLWLFLPGRHTSVTDAAKASVSKLKVVGSGIWLAPGDSEDVAFALSQSLRNRIERSLKVLSYERFGNVFTKCHPIPSIEKSTRRMQPAFEFVFSATEEAIYVLAMVSMRNVRSLSGNDLERASRSCFSGATNEGLPVIVAPSGMRGRFNGCSPTDLVKQAYSSKSSNEPSSDGKPQSSLPSPRGKNCYAEITLGCPSVFGEKIETKLGSYDNVSQCHQEDYTVSSKKNEQKHSSHQLPVFGKTFIFSAEKVLVPVLHGAFTHFSFRRSWLQNWMGVFAQGMQSSWSLSGGSFVTRCLGFGSASDIKFSDEIIESSFMCPNNGKNRSTSSSISSTSSTSSETDDTMASGAVDLEADSDSLTCRQSGLSSSEQFGTDSTKVVSKLSRSSMTESFGQTGTPASGISQDQYKHECNIDEAGNMVSGHADNQGDCYLDWGDEDRDVEVDIQSLLLDFGDFGDFFKDDFLAFGEPPGTIASQAPIFSSADSVDILGSPYSGRIDPLDQSLLPALSFPPSEDFNPLVPQSNMEPLDRAMEISVNPHMPSGAGNVIAHSSGKYDNLMKAEALMTFASEYSAVETPKSELSTTIFRSPYLPKCKSAESAQSRHSGYVYSATPPTSRLTRSDDIDEISNMAKSSNEIQETTSNNLALKCYNNVKGQKVPIDARPTLEEITSNKKDAISSVSTVILPGSATVSQRKKMEKILEAGMLISPKILLATEMECCVFQAAMRSIRHTLLACNGKVMRFNRLSTTSICDNILGDPSLTSSMPLSSYDVKKDLIPVRIAGDADGMLEQPFPSPVGIWRTVGTAKALKPPDVLNIDSSAMSNNMFIAESFPFNGRRSVLQDFLDSLPLLVQQSSSFVDISLDACDGEGPYDWLGLQEQMRRSFCCGPSMVHAGCGGLLATCHSLDIAGVDLINPLSADVLPSSVIGLLQSDVKVALRSAFGNLDGPLSAVDWCRCHNQSGDIDMHFVESHANDPSSTLSFGGEPISPSTALSGVTTSLKDGTRLEETSQRRMSQEPDLQIPHSKSSVSFIPAPALLVGYQDDWLRTSANSLKLWEKAPFEPYAPPKPLTYYAVCPDVDILTSAATDFFLQLGAVYEACKLGTHSPYFGGTPNDSASRKLNLSGLVLVDCPQPVKAASQVGAMSDFLVALSKEWGLASFLQSVTKAVKSLKICSGSGTQKEGSSSPSAVIYIICPFPEPNAILQTLVESSAALGSSIFSSEREGQFSLHSQVAKALNGLSPADETTVTNVPMLSGFNIRKLVLQIVGIDMLLRVCKPMDDLMMFKEIAFTVYNKARRIPRSFYNNDVLQSSSLSRPSTLINVSSPTPGLWKDCLVPRISGAQMIREGDMDSAMRHGSWDNSWQTLRTGVLNCDPNKFPDVSSQDDLRYLFEPLFILAEPGSVEAGLSVPHFGASIPESSRAMMDESANTYMQNVVSGGSIDASAGSLNDGSEHEQKTPSFHCCYGWTEDWRWLISVWTDARGEFLDSQVFPFGGISSRQDTKVLQRLFVQILNQGCQVLSSLACDSSSPRSRDITIARIGCFFELECQEWQKAIHSVGGNEIRKWPVHLRRLVSGVPNSNSGTLQPEMSLLQDRNIPSSPSPLYSPHSKSSSYIKNSLVQNNPKKPVSAGQVDSSRGLFQLVQSISLIGVSMDHSLQLVCPADIFFSGGGSQTSNSSTLSSCLDGLTPMKSLGSSPHSFLFIPHARMCSIPPNPLQLPTCLTSESPPLAHLLHSKGSAIPVSTAYVVSKAIPNPRRTSPRNTSVEWPSVLSVSLVDYYGASTNNFHEKMARGGGGSSRQCRNSSGNLDNGREHEVDTRLVLESVAAELHSLSWLTVSPAYSERRTSLPFHCDTLLRLRRLLHYADRHFCQRSEKRERIDSAAATR